MACYGPNIVVQCKGLDHHPTRVLIKTVSQNQESRNDKKEKEPE